MLDTDLCMVYGHSSGALNSRSANCCAWIRPQTAFDGGAVETGENFCGRDYTATLGATDNRATRGICCGKQQTIRALADCDSLNRPVGPAYNDVLDFASNEDEWLETYVAAWKMAQENGWTTLKPLETASTAPTTTDDGTNTTTQERTRRRDRQQDGSTTRERRGGSGTGGSRRRR